MAMHQKKKAIGLLVLSSFFFALMSTFVRLAGDLPSVQKMVFRNSVSAVAAAVILLRDRQSLAVPKESRLPLATRILCGAGAVFCNYYAIDRLLLANSNSLSKLSPFFAIVFAGIFLGERVTKTQAGCIGLALLGSGFLIFPNRSALGPSAAIGLLGGILSGGAHVSLRALRKKDQISGSVIVFWFSALSLIGVLIPALADWRPMSPAQLICLLLAGSSCAAAQFGLTEAYRYAPPREISIFDFSQILFSGLLGFVVFGQVPGLYSWAAYGFILLAAGLLFHSQQEKPENAPAGEH